MMEDKKELMDSDLHLANAKKVVEMVFQRYQAQAGEVHTSGGSFGFGVGRNWVEAGLMSVGTNLLTGAISNGFGKHKVKKKQRQALEKIEKFTYDAYYDEFVKKKKDPKDITNDDLIHLAEKVCWSMGLN